MLCEVVTVSIDEVLPVRIAAFSDRGVSPGGHSPGDETAIHNAVRVDGKVVCVGTLNHDPSPRSDYKPVWRVRGMATLPEHQGRGYGRKLLRACIQQIAQDGGGLLWGNLRVAAVPFYESYGFAVHDDVFASVNGALHRYGEMLILR